MERNRTTCPDFVVTRCCKALAVFISMYLHPVSVPLAPWRFDTVTQTCHGFSNCGPQVVVTCSKGGRRFLKNNLKYKQVTLSDTTKGKLQDIYIVNPNDISSFKHGGEGCRGIGVQSLAGARKLSLLYTLQIRSKAHPASYLMCNRDFSPGDKGAGT
jgi:hypothetical protein